LFCQPASALIAFALSLVGLFGLAAFMAESRTREIGIRKVMGAEISQLVRLMVWQFSRPVIWALFIALPAAYVASNMYLNFFANRLPQIAFIILFAGIVAVLFSWLIVAIHAYKVARATRIRALLYE
jgi:putative ABC transport system permease protein